MYLYNIKPFVQQETDTAINCPSHACRPCISWRQLARTLASASFALVGSQAFEPEDLPESITPQNAPRRRAYSWRRRILAPYDRTQCCPATSGLDHRTLSLGQESERSSFSPCPCRGGYSTRALDTSPFYTNSEPNLEMIMMNLTGLCH